MNGHCCEVCCKNHSRPVTRQLSHMMMFQIVLACALSAVMAQDAARFPAGVDPASCPGYPNCDNARLHGTAPQPNPLWNAPAAPPSWNAPAPSWNAPAPSWNAPAAPSWNAPAPSWNAPAAPSWNAPAPSWNAPATPSWNAPAPSWNEQAPSWNAPAAPSWNAPAAPAPGLGGDKYPAGVNPQSCPNYPYCDQGVSSGAPQVAPLPGWTERVYPAGVGAAQCPNYPYCS